MRTGRIESRVFVPSYAHRPGFARGSFFRALFFGPFLPEMDLKSDLNFPGPEFSEIFKSPDSLAVTTLRYLLFDHSQETASRTIRMCFSQSFSGDDRM